MEIWFLFALICLLSSGYMWFLLKVISKRNYDKNYVLFLKYLIGAGFAGIMYFYNYWWNISIPFIKILIVIASIKAIFSYYVSVFKVEGLRDLDSILFFPLYKVFSITFVSIVSIIIFSEYLLLKEIIWILVWALVPILLINKAENKLQWNLKRGLFYTIFWAFFLSFSALINNIVAVYSFNIELFLFISLLIWAFISYIKYNNNTSIKNNFNTKWLYSFSLALWFMTFLASYSFIKALNWNLAIVYTLTSFSLLIPILLSIIFYKEKITYKKILVIILSIVSILLFI